MCREVLTNNLEWDGDVSNRDFWFINIPILGTDEPPLLGGSDRQLQNDRVYCSIDTHQLESCGVIPVV